MGSMPRMIYGTAWKKDRTTALVVAAVRAGFSAIDTAAQRKHYRQDLVGRALAVLQSEHGIRREDLFLQTKYTSPSGQDLQGFIPYDLKAPLAKQVKQSFESSLAELQTTYIDSLLLHSPERTVAKTVEALLALKPYVDNGQLRYIGISNIYDPEAVKAVHEQLSAHGLRIGAIQNRFYTDSGYDHEIRKFCSQNGIAYQSFWTLTANPHVLRNPSLKQITKRLELTPEQVFYAYCIHEGITPLNGTTSEEHMRLGVEIASSRNTILTQDEMLAVRALLH